MTVTRASASDTLTVNWAMSKIPHGMTVGNAGGVVAEANVPYTDLKEMDAANHEFATADVALVSCRG